MRQVVLGEQHPGLAVPTLASSSRSSERIISFSL